MIYENNFLAIINDGTNKFTLINSGKLWILSRRSFNFRYNLLSLWRFSFFSSFFLYWISIDFMATLYSFSSIITSNLIYLLFSSVFNFFWEEYSIFYLLWNTLEFDNFLFDISINALHYKFYLFILSWSNWWFLIAPQPKRLN